MSKLTIKEWESLLKVNILNYEGFDKSDPLLFEKKISKEDFEAGLVKCTVQIER